ncbi:MAG: winged helix-turn-helix transcriptional regulator [Thermoplasmatota archaeon]
MGENYLSETEIKILKEIAGKGMTMSQIGKEIDLSLSTISGSVSHLADLGLIEIERYGRLRFVKIPGDEIGNKLRSFILGRENIDCVDLFRGNGLLILVSISGNGATINDIRTGTGLSRITVTKYIKKWRRTGIIWKEGHGGKYSINRNFPDLRDLLSAYSRYLLSDELRKDLTNPLILFNDGETIIFSFEGPVNDEKYRPAAYSFLALEGYDVVTDRDYYTYNRSRKDITDLEALIQAIRIDTLNPRPRKIFRKLILDEKVNNIDITDLAVRYGVEEIIEDEVKRIER